MKYKSKVILGVVLSICLGLSILLSGCGGSGGSGSSASSAGTSASGSESVAASSASVAPAAAKYASAKDLDGKVVGAQSGTTGADWVTENLPNATLKNFNMTSEALAALQTGDIEAVFFDEPVAVEQVSTTYQNCMVLETIPTGEQYGFAVAKENSALKEQVNAALQTLKQNGKFDAIFQKYFPGATPPSLKSTDSAAPSGGELKLVTPGVLTVASDCDYPPFIELNGDTPEGYEFDLMKEIAAELGLTLQYMPPQNFDGILVAIAGGSTADIGVSSFTINNERLELVDFCIPYYDSNQACVVLKSNAA
jgi:polar amino acid transport system substrate-binding protein